MSLKLNVIANYASQAYVALIGVLIVPMYLTYMGKEAFGLVGFFTVVAAWFQLLDVGLTPAMSREASRFAGGEVGALALRNLLRALEGIFVSLALLASVAMIAGSGILAEGYFKTEHLADAEVKRALAFMIVVVALRWISGLYKGLITGLERIIWLGGFNVTVATARFVLVIPVLAYVSTAPTAFFAYQALVAAAELAALVWKTYSLLPGISQRVSWEWKPVRKILPFALSLALTATMWALVANTDKLVLSKLLPLGDYGYFTLGVLAASGITLIGLPINLALLPRMTRMAISDDNAGLISLYQKATQLVGVLAIPACLVLAFFAEQVIWAWTGDAKAAHEAAPVLTLYSLGNGLLVMCTLAQYLQYAKGDVKLHLTGQALFVGFLLPSVIWATLKYGMVGAGYVWLLANALYFLCWVPKVHARFYRGLHVAWLRQIGMMAALTLAVAALARAMLAWPGQRAIAAAEIVVVGIVLALVALSSSAWARAAIGSRLRTGA